MRAKLRATMKFLLRIGLSICLLAWLISRTNSDDLLAAFLDLSFFAWAVAFLMYLASQVISSIRWYFLAHALDFTGPWSVYLRYYFVGLYFNLFLPTSVGGDVLKMHFISRGEPKKLRATYSLVADRLFGFAAMLLLGAGAVLIGHGILPHFEHLLCVAGICVIASLLGLPMAYKLLGSAWPKIGKRLAVFLVFWEKPKALFAALSLSLVLQVLGISAVVLLAKDMGLSPPAAFYFAAFPLVAILTVLPISFNGIGLREGGFIFFLGLKGISAEKALTLSLSFFAIQIAASLIGGLAYAFGLHKKLLKDYAEKM
ncbi:MAG: flippase-like domain-containing protein [Deltaproteobacteria bacterium]|nr:flippase-like domain-containing protein [Deltaproteobacteria bacterium]